MRPPDNPVAAVPVGGVTTATLLWRWRRNCHVTVAAKATFALQHRTLMSPIVPLPIEDHELVPYRPAADVVVVSAHAFSERPVEATAVRLVLRGRAPLIDKSLLVYAPRPGGVVDPFQKAAIVKRHGQPQALVIDPRNPSQRGTYGRIETEPPAERAGGDGVMKLDDDVAWESFHSAPTDQRVHELHGDEWLIVEGMTSHQRRLESRLPGALVETRVYAPDLWCGRSLPVSMVPCTLSIDVDNLNCSLVWRGAFTVEDVETARALTLVTALHVPGLVTSWPSVEQVAASVALESHKAQLAGLASTERQAEPPHAALTHEEELKARVAARLQALGPLANLPVEDRTQPMEDDTAAAAGAARMLVMCDGRVGLRPNDPLAFSVTESGTLDLPADKSELAPPSSTPAGLERVAGAPWSQRDPFLEDAAQRGAGGTVIADDPPELDDRDVDTLEHTLTDSLDEMAGDPIAELFDVGRIKPR